MSDTLSEADNIGLMNIEDLYHRWVQHHQLPVVDGLDDLVCVGGFDRRGPSAGYSR